MGPRVSAPPWLRLAPPAAPAAVAIADASFCDLPGPQPHWAAQASWDNPGGLTAVLVEWFKDEISLGRSELAGDATVDISPSFTGAAPSFRAEVAFRNAAGESAETSSSSLTPSADPCA